MLSEDFALCTQDRMPWEMWYQEEIVENDMYKTLFFSYKGILYQFEPTCHPNIGRNYNGHIAKAESYIFFEYINFNKPTEQCINLVCYDSFKDAIDNAKMEDGKTFKEIWDDPDGEVIDFL